MKTTTLIKRAAAKLEKQMLKDGCTDAQVKQALRINFPSLQAILAGKPTGQQVFRSRINLENSFRASFKAAWGHQAIRRFRCWPDPRQSWLHAVQRQRGAAQPDYLIAGRSTESPGQCLGLLSC